MKQLLIQVCADAHFMGLNTLHEAVINAQMMMSHGSYAEIPAKAKALNDLTKALKEHYGEHWGDMTCRHFLSPAQLREIELELDAMSDGVPYTKPEFLL